MKNKFILLLPLLLAAGCATEPVKMDTVSPMMATSFADGEMTITWKGEPGQVYTVYYSDAPRGTRPDWKPLPQANGLTGQGAQITVSDKTGPDLQRRYLLLSGDQKPY